MSELVPAWYLALVVATGLQRLRELDISRRNIRSAPGAAAAPAGFRFMVAINLALFVAPLVEVALRRKRPRLGAAGAWTAVLLSATLLRWFSIRSLGSAWNVRAVVPEPFTPVARGPYRFIRHPNYLAVIAEFAALPMAGGAGISAIVLSALNGLVLAHRIPAEERLLDGSARYRELFADKSRFIPGVF